MDLKEYIEKEKEDSNLFWKLSEGDRQNLLDEAIDRLEDREKYIKELKERIKEMADELEYYQSEIKE